MTQEALAEQSFVDHGVQRLRALSAALDFGADQEKAAIDVFGCMLDPWGAMRIGSAPRWASGISDDHSPYEFSLALTQNGPELRFLVEAQASDPSPRDHWSAGVALSEALESRFGASLDRLRAIEDLYIPNDRTAGFAAWHAAGLHRSGAAHFKIYLNPQARGQDQAASLIKESLVRLGMATATESLPRGRAIDEIKYFSLDLSRSTRARVKIYSIHPRASLADIEAVVRSASSYVPGEATDFCKHMAGAEIPFCTLPVQTCLAFVEGSDVPVEATIHFPIRAYAPSDITAQDRILRYMNSEASALYSRAIETFARRPLDTGPGIHSYVSLRMQHGRRHLTIYLSAELYGASATSWS